MMPCRTARSVIAGLSLSLALAACAESPAALSVRSLDPTATPAAKVAAPLRPLPTARSRGLVEVTGGGSLAGTAQFQLVSEPFFASSAAYGVLAMPVGRALLHLSTLEEDLLVLKGTSVTGATAADGSFTLSGVVPTDMPYVVNAQFVRGHRLSSLVPAGASSVAIDEASTMITEMARWQLPVEPEYEEGPSIRDLDADTLASLLEDTRSVATAADVPVSTGDLPDIASLKTGSGHVLRNAYVARFGAAVSDDPDSTAPADRLSDLWQALLGFRPLALTAVAGNGSFADRQADGKPATEAPLLLPIDAVADPAGNLYVTEQDAHAIRFVPAAGRGPLLAWPSAMTAGDIHTIVGVKDGPTTLEGFDAVYAEDEAAAVDDPLAAPLVSEGAPVYSPHKLVVEPTDSGVPHLFFTSFFGNRLHLIPGERLERFGRVFEPGRLYTVAGGADDGDVTDELYTDDCGDGGPAHAAALLQPTGLVQDSYGNMYVLDAGFSEGATVYHGRVRVIRAADGAIGSVRFVVPRPTGEVPYTLAGAHDMRLVESEAGNFLYVADTNRHIVVRAALPEDLGAIEEELPATAAVSPVLGATNRAGFLKPEIPLPALYQSFDGVAEAGVLLNGPTSLEFDRDGNLLVADAGNGMVRMLDAAGVVGSGTVYTLAGGFDTRYLSGDSRLAYLPGTTYLNREPATGHMLLVDRFENLVRRLWTGRGAW